ncbi:MAG: hypothetical protein LBS62_14205 [Clostridiales bacterium]|jgi:hypothetical protein|nr:hypothetical protein [Clostridiales bacterium]
MKRLKGVFFILSVFVYIVMLCVVCVVDNISPVRFILESPLFGLVYLAFSIGVVMCIYKVLFRMQANNIQHQNCSTSRLISDRGLGFAIVTLVAASLLCVFSFFSDRVDIALAILIQATAFVPFDRFVYTRNNDYYYMDDSMFNSLKIEQIIPNDTNGVLSVTMVLCSHRKKDVCFNVKKEDFDFIKALPI